MRETVPPDLDVVNLGMMMAEISPPRLGLRIDESDYLSLHVAGSATIFALALARLGGRVGLISRVGDDQLGGWLLNHARAEGIDTEAVASVSGELTPLLLASVDHNGNKTFSFYRFAGACDPLITFRAADVDDHYLARGRVFDLAEGSLRSPTLRQESLTLARRARALGRTVCFSPNFRVDAWAGGAEEASGVLRDSLSLADLAIMNETEAMLLATTPSVAEATAWFTQHGPSLTVITRGREPALVIAAGAVREAPAFDVEVIYDIGAGDVFHAGFLAAWRAGSDPVLAACFAAAAAAIKISRPPESVHMPTRAETLAFLRDRGIDSSALET
jgi:sugar/nucleoside kinase (ribokinase family)